MTNENKPICIMIIGPNGAGKSTFYHNILKQNSFFKDIEYVNFDDKYSKMASQSSPNVNKNILMGLTGRVVLEQINKNIQNRKSFIYETTSAGKSQFNIIKYAKAQNFQIMTMFIGLSNVNLSIMRVKERVAHGGHNIPENDIIRRYPMIIKNFPEFLNVSDIFFIFDNSGIQPFRLIFAKTNDSNHVFAKFPKYITNSLNDYGFDSDVISITNEKFKKLTPEEYNILIRDIVSRIKLYTSL